MAEADEATVDKFIELHDKSDLQEEKMRIAVSLGCVTKENLIKKVLEFAISVRTVSTQMSFLKNLSLFFSNPIEAIGEIARLSERDLLGFLQHIDSIGLRSRVEIHQGQLGFDLFKILIRFLDNSFGQGNL